MGVRPASQRVYRGCIGKAQRGHNPPPQLSTATASTRLVLERQGQGQGQGQGENELVSELTSEGARRRAAPALHIGERELRREVLGRA